MYEVVQFLYVDEQEEHLQNLRSYDEVEKAVNSFYQRLTKWYENLPECIQEGQSWTPAVLGLQYVNFFLRYPSQLACYCIFLNGQTKP